MSDFTTTGEIQDRILASLHSSKVVSGLTHNFYRYPARMSPELVREIICHFSQPGDYILDPFMGGATSIVEALAAGRRAVGIDLNPLAYFVASAKTTPLSNSDGAVIRRWAEQLNIPSAEIDSLAEIATDHRAKNLPDELNVVFAQLINAAASLSFPRHQLFARCALLRVGQWAVDCKNTFPDANTLKGKLTLFVEEMLSSLDEFVEVCGDVGVAKNRITGQRKLLLRSTVGAENDSHIRGLSEKPTLVMTSPPYPGIHVLYHRWQVSGRRETPAPYWLIGANDGHGSSYYTFGSRDTHLGIQNYFNTLVDAYRSVRAVIHPDALVVQLVAFSDVALQLPAFLEAMERAGYQEDALISTDRTNLWRTVPNRKWYNRISAARAGTQELLLFHRPVS